MKSIILCFRTAVFVLRFALLTTLILLCLVHATDTQVRAEVTARFEVGAIAEYTNAAHNNQNPSLFSQNPRSIESVLLKQSSEVWGGTQGNDSDVTLQINYFNGSVLTLSGAFSWVKNSGGGGGINYFGVVFDVQPNDGFPTNNKRTYIFPLPAYRDAFITNVATSSVTGSANFGVNEFEDLRAELNESYGGEAGISLEKIGVLDTGDNETVDAGDKINYSFRIKNTGDLSISNINITDDLLNSDGSTLVGSTIDSLAPGQVDDSTFSGSYTITSADIESGGVRNTAVVTGNTIIGTVSDVSGVFQGVDRPTDVVFDQKSSIKLVKEAIVVVGSDGLVNAGDTINYKFKVINDGEGLISDISISDSKLVPEYPHSVSGDPISLEPGQVDENNFSGTYTLTQSDIDAGFVENSAFVIGTDQNGWSVQDVSGTSTDNDFPTSVILPTVAKISLVKAGAVNASGDGGSAIAGDNVAYTFTVKNEGNVTLYNVRLVDAFLQDAGTLGGGQILSLPPGAIDSFTFYGAYNLTDEDIGNGSVTNTATVIASSPENTDDVQDVSGTSVSNNEPTITYLLQSPSIESWKISRIIDLDNNQTLSAGDAIYYEIYIKNTGNVPLDNVRVLSDTLTRADGSSISGVIPEFNIFNGGTTLIQPGEITQYIWRYDVNQADIDAGGLSNTAVVSGSFIDNEYTDVTDDEVDADGAETNESDPTINLVSSPPLSGSAGLTVTKTAVLNDGDDGLSAGDTISYTITAKNTGSVTLDNVKIADTLTPQGGSGRVLSPEFVSASDTDEVGVLSVGETWQWTVSYEVLQSDIDAGGVSNLAAVTADDPGDTPITVESSVSGNSTPGVSNGTGTTTLLSGSAGLTVTKTADRTEFVDPVPGETKITYTIVATNTGNVTLSSVSIGDEISVGLYSSQLYPVIDDQQTGAADDDDELDVGETWVWTVEYVLREEDLDSNSIENVAYVRGDYSLGSVGASGRVFANNLDNSTEIVNSSGSVIAYSGANGVPSNSSVPPLKNNGVVTRVAMSTPAEVFDPYRELILEIINSAASSALRNSMSASRSMMDRARTRFIDCLISDSRELYSNISHKSCNVFEFVSDGGLLFDIVGGDYSVKGNGAFRAQTGFKSRVNYGIDATFNLNFVSSNDYLASYDVRLFAETFVNNDSLLGVFVGSDFNSGIVQRLPIEGSVSGFSLFGGARTTSRVSENVLIDFYALFGWGLTAIDLHTVGPVSVPLVVDGDYSSLSWQLGGSITGVWGYDEIQILPNVKLAYGKTSIGDISLTARANGGAQTVSLSADAVHLFEARITPEVRIPLSFWSLENHESRIGLAPMLVCQFQEVEWDWNTCGWGGEVELNWRLEDSPVQMSLEAGYEAVGSREQVKGSLGISVEW